MATSKQPRPPSDSPATVAPTPQDDLFARLVTARDLPQSDKIKMLVYGPSGSGKSTFAARFPRPLFGLTELQAGPSIVAANPDAAVFPILNASDLMAFRKLLADPRTAQRFDTVILDSLTDAQRIIKEFYTSKQDKRTDITNMDSWGLVIDGTARLARELRDREYHTVLICLDAEESVDGVGTVHRPGVHGKRLPNDLAQYVNAVAYLAKEEDLDTGALRRTLTFEAGERYLTKGLQGLRAREPAEPAWVLHKALRAPEPAPEVLARVRAWEGPQAPETNPVTQVPETGATEPAAGDLHE